MATYKGINGFAVQSVASDPTFDEGQVWYNNVGYAFKLATLTTAGTFSTGGSRSAAVGGMGVSKNGTQSAVISAGGSGPVISYGTNSESYNGTSWTNTPSLNTGRDTLGGAGTQTATIVFGGNLNPVTTATESWNGTSWTSVNSMNPPARLGIGGCGLQTAAIGTGGYAGGVSNQLQSWNGTSWTTGTSMGTSRYSAGTFGTQTAATTAGGGINPSGGTTAVSETWNGTSWTAIASINTSRSNNGGAGTQNLGLIMGGPPNSTATELWNGTSWTTNPNGLNTGRGMSQSACGTQALALAFNGPTLASEEWTGPGTAITKTITTS